MSALSLIARLRELSDMPELRRAQFIRVSRMFPLLYAVIAFNIFGLSYTFYGKAPPWLAEYAPAGAILICCIRLSFWWRRRNAVYTDQQIEKMLRATNWVGLTLAILFSSWAFSLFSYSDDYAKGHIAFCVALTVLIAIYSLIHRLSTALSIAIITGIIFIVFFGLSGNVNFIMMALTFLMIMMATMIIVTVQNHDFSQITRAQAAERQEREKQSRLLHMVDHMPIPVMTADPEMLRINYYNDAFEKLIWQLEKSLPMGVHDLMGAPIDAFIQNLDDLRLIISNPDRLPFDYRITLEKEIIDCKISAVIGGDGGYISAMFTFAVVTEKVAAEKRIQRLAHHDTLTELPNRATFNDDLNQRLGKPGSKVGLLLMDLDNFKLINDTRGHVVGDALLCAVADRLRKVANAPAMSVARIGGDEFALLKAGNDSDDALRLAEKVTAILSEPYDLAHGTARIGVSIGLAVAPDHGVTANDLLGRADTALYAAKGAGKGVVQMFTSAMEIEIQARATLENQLREALRDKQDLFVLYQPIVSIETGQVMAREALVQWNQAKRGLISPAEFIPIAEQSSLIDILGEFVLATACRDAATWTDGARVSVNVSANQLGKGSLVPTIVSILHATGLPPGRLEIEVTETAILKEEPAVIEDLREIRALGIQVALDDFGTGYSSLTHLRVFPFDKIKIDGSFVKEVVERPDCAAIIHAIADLGSRLGVTIVAEGVETQSQFESIRQKGCTQVQGYLFGHPIQNELISTGLTQNTVPP
jgi:diguanylate cyclase (GGDEF)-like protein